MNHCSGVNIYPTTKIYTLRVIRAKNFSFLGGGVGVGCLVMVRVRGRIMAMVVLG